MFNLYLFNTRIIPLLFAAAIFTACPAAEGVPGTQGNLGNSNSGQVRAAGILAMERPGRFCASANPEPISRDRSGHMNSNLDRYKSSATSAMKRNHATSSLKSGHTSGWWLTRSNTTKPNPKPSLNSSKTSFDPPLLRLECRQSMLLEVLAPAPNHLRPVQQFSRED
jgi:hypothetical protein